MSADTPAGYPHRPVLTIDDKVAQAMAEGDTVHDRARGRRSLLPARSHEIAAKLGVTDVYVRSTQKRIREKLGPQAC